MIEIKDLTKYYGDLCAVDHVSFDIHKGEILGLLGPNGAGKTTIYRILTGYLRPTSGDIRVKDFDIHVHHTEIKRLIGSGIIGQVTTIMLVRHESHALQEPPFRDQRYFVDMERLLLIESVIHLIDVARFLGGDIGEIYCDLRRVSGATRGEDNVHLHLRLRSGAWGIIYSTRCSEPDTPSPVCDYARIEGKEGFVRLDRDGTLTVKPRSKPGFRQKYELPKVGYRGDSCRAALQHFVGCLCSGEAFETEGEDYLNQVMAAVFAGYESAETRRSVSLLGGSSRGAWKSVRVEQ